MEFKRARSEEQVDIRKRQIIDAAFEIYQKDGYEAVIFSEIAKKTSFTRPAIYSYYKTRDDILMDIVGDLFHAFNEDLQDKLEGVTELTQESLIEILYELVLQHEELIKMVPENYSCIEYGCTDIKLQEAKVIIMKTFEILEGIATQYFGASKEKANLFAFSFFITIMGVYPISHPSIKQQKAIDANNPNFVIPDYNQLLRFNLEIVTDGLKD